MKLQELIQGRFFSQKNSQQAIHAIIHKQVIDTFLEEKNIDISMYLQSVKLMNSTIIIKTNKPLISEEIQHISGKLGKKLQEKLEKMGKKYTNLDIITK